MVLQLPYLTPDEKMEFMLASPNKIIIDKIAEKIIQNRIKKYGIYLDKDILKILIDEIYLLKSARSKGLPKKLPKPTKTKPIYIPKN